MSRVDIGGTFGPLLVGSMLSMAVYGITTLQAYFYFTYYPKDSHWLKLLVATIWSLDTVHVIFMCHAMYYYLITGFGDVRALGQGTWSLYASIAINIIIAFTVQSFFTQRIFSLSPRPMRWWISGVIGFFVLAHFCTGIETVIYFFIKKDFSRLDEVKFISVLPFGVTAILSDIFVAAALCLLLASNRSEFEDTNLIIHRLIIFAINRCILTSVVAVVEVVVFTALPNSFYSFAFDFIIGKLYANSLLATLNSRSALRSKEYGEVTVQGTALSFRSSSIATNDERPVPLRVPIRNDPGSRRRVTTDSTVRDVESKDEMLVRLSDPIHP